MSHQPIFTTGPATRSTKLSSEFTAPMSEVLKAEAEQAWVFSPLDSIMRAFELSDVSAGVRVKPEIMAMDPVSRKRMMGKPNSLELIESSDPGFFKSRITPDQILTKEMADERIAEAGVKIKAPSMGITKRALDIIIARKKVENDRKQVLQRAEQNLATGAARLVVGFGVTMLDPTNLVSAFIPVVNTMRYRALLAGRTTVASRAALRAKVGAVEGTVGAAAVEPFIMTATAAEQADYTLNDTLLNIAFGTVLGGGLHAGGGAALDAVKGDLAKVRNQGAAAEALSRVDMETREGFTRSALAQMTTDRNVDLTVMGAFTPVRATERRTLVQGRTPELASPDVEDIVRELDPVLMRRYDDLQVRKDFLRKTLEDLEAPREQRAFDQSRELRETIAQKEDQLERSGARQQKRIRKELDVLRAQLDEFTASVKSEDSPDMRRVRRELQDIDIKQRDMSEDITPLYQRAQADVDAFTGQRTREEPEFRVETVFERDRTPGIAEEIEATFNARSDRFADFEAAQEIDEFLAAHTDTPDVVSAANTELADALSQLSDLKARGLDIDDDLGIEDAVLTLAGEQSKGIEALALCSRRS